MAPSFLLRVGLSWRALHAHVTNLSTKTIVAMVSTKDPEFVILYNQARIRRRDRKFVDQKLSYKIGEKLGGQLREIGIEEVEIDIGEEKMRPLSERRVLGGLFASVEEAGVRVVGAQELNKLQ